MPARAKIGMVMSAGVLVFLTLPFGRAQAPPEPAAATNAAPIVETNQLETPPVVLVPTNHAPVTPLQQALSPLTNQTPAAVTNQASASPAAAPEMAEAEKFFTAYSEAAQFVRVGSTQEGYVVMDVLAKSLHTSPWREIAWLKRSELAETANNTAAIEGYQAVLQNLDTEPYYRGVARRARLFSAALQGAAERGIARVRLSRVRVALDKYFARYLQYPESLNKLAIFNYIPMEDISDANRRPFRYVPTGLQFRPTIHYQRYDILDPAPPAEPFIVRSPRLDTTSRISDHPEKYVAVIRVPGRLEPRRAGENEIVDGNFIGAVSASGALVVSANHVLVLPVPR